MNLRWTDAGRAALASSQHVGSAAVKLIHLAIGDGQGAGGAGDDGRTALRSERHRAALAADTSVSGKIAARADFEPDAAHDVTEAGIFATVGDPPGAAFLAMYWSDSGTVAAKAAVGTKLAIAAVIEFQNAAADVTAEVSATVTFGNVDEATDGKFGTTRYASQTETETGTAGNRAVTPKGLKAAIGKVAAFLLGKAATDGTIYQLKGKAGGGLLAEKRTLPNASTTQKGIVELADDAEAKKGTDAARAVTPKALKAATDALSVPDATTSQKGVVELATGDEAKAGTDTAKAVTPAGLKAGVAALPSDLASKVPKAGSADKTYVIKRAKSSSGGGLSIVEAVFRRYVTIGAHNFTVPAGVTRLRVMLIGAGGGGGGGGRHHGVTPTNNGSAGGDSKISRGSSDLALASGGGGGTSARFSSPGRGGAGRVDGSDGQGRKAGRGGTGGTGGAGLTIAGAGAGEYGAGGRGGNGAYPYFAMLSGNSRV